MAEPELSNEQLFESTKDVLSEAFDKMQAENHTEDDELDLNTPTFDEAQEEQKAEEEPKAEVEEKPAKEEDKEAEPEVEAKAEDKPEETAEVELSDEEIFNNLKPKAQERFKDLVSRSKELEDRISQLEPSEAVASHVLSSGTQPDQLNFALDVFKSLNSGNWEQARGALNKIDEFSNIIAERLGVSDKGNNDKSSYGDFEDLSGAVENLEMSEDWANKLAQQRVRENSINQSKQEFDRQNVESYQQQQNFSQEQDQAYNEIKAWEESVKTSDADFDSKRDIMLDIGEKIANSGVNPSSWLPLLRNEYEVLSRGMSLASKRTNASKNSGPLAPSSSSSGNVDSTDLKQAEVTPEFLQYHLDQLHNR